MCEDFQAVYELQKRILQKIPESTDHSGPYLVTRHAARHALTKLLRGDQLDDLCTAQIWFGRTGNALDFGRSVSDLYILRDLACAGAAARDAYHIRRLATGEQERRQYEGEERGHVGRLGELYRPAEDQILCYACYIVKVTGLAEPAELYSSSFFAFRIDLSMSEHAARPSHLAAGGEASKANLDDPEPSMPSPPTGPA